MGGVWKEARKRAWADVLDILRLKPRRRAVVTLGLLVAVAVASWTYTGVVAVTAAASAAWLVVAGLGLYLWGLVTAPAKIAAELQQKLDHQEDAEKVAARRVTAARLLSQAEHIGGLCGGSEPINEHMVSEWYERARRFMVDELGEEYLHLFESDAGLLHMVPTGPGITKRNREVGAWMTKRATRLVGIMEELRRG